jgi:hypothetical protein
VEPVANTLLNLSVFKFCHCHIAKATKIGAIAADRNTKFTGQGGFCKDLHYTYTKLASIFPWLWQEKLQISVCNARL